jgi:hypothetical protein
MRERVMLKERAEGSNMPDIDKRTSSAGQALTVRTELAAPATNPLDAMHENRRVTMRRYQ